MSIFSSLSVTQEQATRKIAAIAKRQIFSNVLELPKKEYKANCKKSDYLADQVDAIKKNSQAIADTIYAIENDDAFAEYIDTVLVSLGKNIDKVLESAKKREAENALYLDALQEEHAQKLAYSLKLDFGMLTSAHVLNTREAKKRLAKNISGVAHSNDLAVYKAIATGELREATPSKLASNKYLAHKTTTQANNIIKLLTNLSACKVKVKGGKGEESVYTFDKDAKFFTEIVTPMLQTA